MKGWKPRWRLPCRVFDNILRWFVKSETAKDPETEYFVDLASYHANGECTCFHFTKHLKPFLERGYSAERVYRETLIEIPEGWAIEDLLRCKHIVDARNELVDLVINTTAANAEKKDPAP